MLSAILHHSLLAEGLYIEVEDITIRESVIATINELFTTESSEYLHCGGTRPSVK